MRFIDKMLDKMREILFRGKRKDNGEWVYCGRKLNEGNTTPSTHDIKQWLFSDLDDAIDCF